MTAEYMFDWRLPGLVRLALKLDDPQLAATLAAMTGPGRALFVACSRTSRRSCASTRETPRPLPPLRGAAAEWDEMDVPYEAALALLGRSRCLIALGRAEEARRRSGERRGVHPPARVRRSNQRSPSPICSEGQAEEAVAVPSP